MSKDLDQILSTRKAPDMPEGLNARIIVAAARAPQEQARSRSLNLFGVFTRLFDELFPSPQPAWAAGVAVVIIMLGFVLGGATDLGLIETGVEGDEFTSFMSVQDNFTAQEWV